ncbi:unnamed protein product [Linum tenue]|uniref:PWWP domain-containing protein n=1 Tax=Linum tenue TaxID=586396 RepID=A0AAV0K725_9ROSI|nr:unnamed protein product [Linum tenue]
MKGGKHQETSRGQEKEDHGTVEGDVAKLSEGKPGDVIWTKLSGRTWWPGLVLDEDAVGRRNKRGKRSERDVLVRLYGSSKQYVASVFITSLLSVSSIISVQIINSSTPCLQF